MIFSDKLPNVTRETVNAVHGWACDVPVMMFSVLDWTGAVAELLRNVSTLSVYSIPAVRPLHMNFETFPAHTSRDTETDVFQPRQHRQ